MFCGVWCQLQIRGIIFLEHVGKFWAISKLFSSFQHLPKFLFSPEKYNKLKTAKMEDQHQITILGISQSGSSTVSDKGASLNDK